MNNISYISGPAEQVHAKIAEIIRNGNAPVLIHQYQPVSQNTSVTSDNIAKPRYARQVVTLGRKS